MKKTAFIIATLLIVAEMSIGQIYSPKKQPVNPWLEQVESPWIKQTGYVAYMWPSFLQMLNSMTTVVLTNYNIQSIDCPPGRIELADCKTSQREALTAALCLIGEYQTKNYGVATDKPNLIPYKNGFILYGYWKEKERWEFFNFNTPAITEKLAYRRFDVVKK